MSNRLLINMFFITVLGILLAGYFAIYPKEKTLPAALNVNPQQEIRTLLKTDIVRSFEVTTTKKNSQAITSTESKSSIPLINNSDQTIDPQKHQTDTTNNTEPKKIGNEEAEKIIPAPFSHALTIFKDEDRKTYKHFADTDLSDDWDLNMQGQLVDAIYSHPYANALKIDSVACKAHICEIRLLATNKNAWPLVFTDLRQQPWWEFGNNYSIYEFGIKQDSQIQTVYFILLTKS